MTRNAVLIHEMADYYTGDPKRIQHFIKVYTFAKTIGEMEQLPSDQQFILETAAIVHDIGIKASEEKYGSCNGIYQEKEGPPIARSLLEKLDYEKTIIDRVCWLIAHHHTYTNIKDLDYQILIEADFLVNLYENNTSKDGILTSYHSIFQTEAGKQICKTMFGL